MKKILLVAIMAIACMGASAQKTGLYFYFDTVDRHIYEDENVFVYISVINPYFTKYAPSLSNASVIVINKTDKVIYVDKGPSFFIQIIFPLKACLGQNLH